MLRNIAVSLLIAAACWAQSCGNSSSGAKGDADSDLTEIEESSGEVGPLEPPLMPSDSLGYNPPERPADGEPLTDAEIAAFTKKITAFFKNAAFFDWVWRMTHGLDASYDASKPPYKLWWQDTTVKREGDTIVFTHVGRAENILKRSVKVMVAAASAYEMTGLPRMAEVAEQIMNGVVALSDGMAFASSPAKAKYLQARAIFNHNHSYVADGRKIRVDYSPMYWDETHEKWYKWNVHVFEAPDNPVYGQVWVSNMRSKDDVPYLYSSLEPITRIYRTTKNEALRKAAARYIEYVRGFSQSVVDNGWQILTVYRDGSVDIARDYTKEKIDGEYPPADLGSFVHWEEFFGPDAECAAQLGTVFAAYGNPGEKGDCQGASPSSPMWKFEKIAYTNNYFNYNIYTYFHIGALTQAHLWNYPEIGLSLMNGLIERFDEIRKGTELNNRDDEEFETDLAGWLLNAAAYGYPLTAAEARHIIKWYAAASDWYLKWPHWDPWTSLKDGEQLDDFIAPRAETIDDGQGGTSRRFHIRLDEMAYVFEYCYSPLRDKGAKLIDCGIVADPAKWGE